MNVLLAYNYWDDKCIPWFQQHRSSVRLLIDSGAFSAFSRGQPVTLDGYMAFLDSLQSQGVPVWRYFALDVIGDPVATRANYLEMRKQGFNPVPIFTRGEDLKHLDEYYETSDVVALGGLVGTGRAAGFVNGVMRHVGNRRVHLLGFTREQYLKHYRPYMCDSSSYSEALRYGGLSIYDGHGGWESLLKKDLCKPLKPAVIKTLQGYGINMRRLVDEQEGWHTRDAEAIHVAIKSWTLWQLHCQMHLNTRLFFAISADLKWADMLLTGWQYWRSRTCVN